jgi:L-ornithine Nalpha-acyltransferase
MRHTSVHCLVASTQRQLDDALRVRWAVFGGEMHLLGAPPPARREVNCFDTLETTVHLVVYAQGRPVATTRLLLPNAEVARENGTRLGIDLEQKFDLSTVGGPGQLFAETTRYCVLREWRGSEVLLCLQSALYQESRRRGVTHWIASANTETDSPEDARLALRVAAHRGLVSERWHVRAHAPGAPPAEPLAPLYSPEERLRAREGRLDGLRLPRTLSFFASKLGARFIGEPLFDAHFRLHSLPLVAALDEIPASTLAHFEGSRADARRAA